MNDGSDEGGVEWVEDRADSSGLDEVVLGPRRSWRGSRRRGVLAALVAVVTLGAATALVLHASNGSDAPGRSARRTVTVPPSPPPLGVAPVSRRVHLTRQVGMDRQWLLYVKVPSGLLRIDLARGTTTQTSVPTETGPTQLVVTGDHALLHSTSMTYVVGPDGVAHRLSGWLADSSRLLPDDDDDAVWGVHGDTVGLVQTGSNEPYRQFELPSTLALRDAEPVDGGDLAVPGAGGVFDVSASRVIQRITTGQLIATGDDVSLVQECNAAYRCSTVRVGEEGQRKRVGPVRTATSSDRVHGARDAGFPPAGQPTHKPNHQRN